MTDQAPTTGEERLPATKPGRELKLWLEWAQKSALVGVPRPTIINEIERDASAAAPVADEAGLREAVHQVVSFLEQASWENSDDERRAWAALDVLREALARPAPAEVTDSNEGRTATLERLLRAARRGDWGQLPGEVWTEVRAALEAAPVADEAGLREQIAETFHDALCTVSHHDRPEVYRAAMGHDQPCRAKYATIAARALERPCAYNGGPHDFAWGPGGAQQSWCRLCREKRAARVEKRLASLEANVADHEQAIGRLLAADIAQAGSGGPDFTPKEWPASDASPERDDGYVRADVEAELDPAVAAWRAYSDRFMDPANRDSETPIRDAFAAGWDSAHVEGRTRG